MESHPTITIQQLASAPDQPLLVLGPSLGTGAQRLWSQAAQSLSGWNVVGWDLPGHGSNTEVAADSGEFTMAELAAAVARAVDAFVGTQQPFAYAGDSVGGAVGLQLALDFPDRVTAVASICSAAKFGTPEAWHERAALVRAQGMQPMVEGSPARWFGSKINASDDGRREQILGDLAAVDPEGYSRVCGALAGFDVVDRLGDITAPVLALAGADDQATPVAVLQQIVDGVPDARLVVLDGVAHLAPYEDPGATAAALTEFFAR